MLVDFMSTALIPKVSISEKKVPVRVGQYAYQKWIVQTSKKTYGKRIRRFADTRAEAEIQKAKLEDEICANRDQYGTIADQYRVDAGKALDLLNGRATLEEAVKFWLEHHPIDRSGSMTLGLGIEAYLADKRQNGCKERYVRDLKITLEKVERSFGGPFALSITQEKFEWWLRTEKFSPVTTKAYIRDTSGLFRFGVYKKWITENPLAHIRRPKVKLHAPEIFSVDEVSNLLKAARAKPDLELLPFLSLAFFSGIRVEELGRVDWSMINWTDKEISLAGEKTKTYVPRNISVSDQLIAWLSLVKKDSGPVVPKGFRNRREKLHTLAEVQKRDNALRHSFASYWARLHPQKATELQAILGQQTPSVLWKHYVNSSVPKAEATKFFALLPE